MKRKLFGILSLSALAAAAVSLSSCSISDEEIFDLNYRRVFIENNLSKDGGQNGVVSGEIRVFTAFTPDFVEKGGKVTWNAYLDDDGDGVYDESTSTEAEKYIPISKVNTDLAKSITVKNPNAGLDDVVVYVVANVEMGQYSKEVVWKLTLQALKIENSALQSILNKMFARVGDGQTNNFAGIKEVNGEALRGYGVSLPRSQGALATTISGIITSSSPEYVNSFNAGRLFNILSTTDENIFNGLDATSADNLATVMTNADNLGAVLGSKTLVQSYIEAVTTGKINGEELNESDRGALENSGVKEVFEKIAKIVNNLPVSADYAGNETYTAIKAFATTL